MRELIVTENVSLDGVAAPMDGWFDPAAQDGELLRANIEHREAADALVLGRVTYQEFAGFWPYQKDDQTGVADYLDQVAKYVVSATLDRADWRHTTILRDLAAVEALKAEQGRDIVVTGSVTLAAALVTAGLVDRYRLFVYPAVQGHGRRPFPAGFGSGLRLTDSRTFTSGVVLLEYVAG